MQPNHPHDWGPPPPGQGGRAEKICRKCGSRRSVVGADSQCLGKASVAVAENVSDYDPFENI